MGRLLGESIGESAKILKELKDGQIRNIRAFGELIIIDGRDNDIITLPIENLLKQKGIEDSSQLTEEDLREYAFNELCKEVLGELGTVEERTVDGKNRILVKLTEGQYISSGDLHGNFSRAIDKMAEKIDSHYDFQSSSVDDFLYSATVTEMKFRNKGYSAIPNIRALLSSVYNLDYGELNQYYKQEMVTSQGKSREIAHRLKGYSICATSAGWTTNGGKTCPVPIRPNIDQIIDARIEGINIVNALYSQMVEGGFIAPFREPRSTNDKYEVVLANIDRYIEQIISDVREIHDNLTLEKVLQAKKQQAVQTVDPWNSRAPVMKEDGGYINPRVALAVSNYYLDGLEMQYDEVKRTNMLGTLEQEKKLATSQKERESRSVQAKKHELMEYSKALDEIENIELYEDNLRELQTRMITGLAEEKEGDIQIDDDLFASTDIGKSRSNQEDAVLLLKDGAIPGFKMMIVADGMGGMDSGEVASHKVVNKIKEWFEELSEEEKAHYYANISDIQQKINDIINEASYDISRELFGRGGATIVCAIIGEHDTLITNVGDSRAYIVRDGKLKQVSRDDATVQKLYEMGQIPTRDAMRFHYKSNEITDDVGNGKLKNIHSTVISNDDYDMVLLFSDGVTDCLSEEEIAVITRETDKSKLSQELVRRALDNYSVAPNEVKGNWNYQPYIPGGKDNTTAAVYVKAVNPNKDDGEER